MFNRLPPAGMKGEKMDFNDAQKAYKIDPNFHQLVDILVSFIDKLQMTPAEIKQAAVFAAYKYECLHIQPHLMPKPENP